MKSSVVKFAVISFALFLAGCAGTKFVRLADDSLVLGQTTQEQIRARLGTPYREGEITKNGQQLQTLSYAYSSSSAGGGADAFGITPARSQGFIFLKDKLVGYEFASSYKEDSTNFDSEKIPQIKTGVSTRSDVVRLLGNPGGKYIYPLIADTNDEATNYMYMQTRGTAINLKSYQKLLVVTFNAQGVVTNVEYTESGEK
jgi:outer membrane protein assembly factor BamE (lipoprotein component of BamABCDE complex)